MRVGLRIFAAATAATFALASVPASAGLDGSTVTTVFWLGASDPPPATCTTTSPYPCEIPNYQLFPGDTAGQNFPYPTVPVSYLLGAVSESYVSVSDEQITITNNIDLPYCSTALPCADPFTGFTFTFSGAPAITKVTVDPGSAANFQPVPSLTFTSTEIVVNLVGLAPAVGDELILDVKTYTPPAIPEPSTWALTLLGFAGLGVRMGRAVRSA
jgi:hypothetical protein